MVLILHLSPILSLVFIVFNLRFEWCHRRINFKIEITLNNHFIQRLIYWKPRVVQVSHFPTIHKNGWNGCFCSISSVAVTCPNGQTWHREIERSWDVCRTYWVIFWQDRDVPVRPVKPFKCLVIHSRQKKTCIHYISFLHIDKTQAVEIFPRISFASTP